MGEDQVENIQIGEYITSVGVNGKKDVLREEGARYTHYRKL